MKQIFAGEYVVLRNIDTKQIIMGVAKHDWSFQVSSSYLEVGNVIGLPVVDAKVDLNYWDLVGDISVKADGGPSNKLVETIAQLLGWTGR